MSDTWDVENGVGQVAVLGGFLLNVLVNGFLAETKHVCNVQVPCKAKFQCAQMTW